MLAAPAPRDVGVRSFVDYALVRQATLHDLRSGYVTTTDVCDPHPDLIRAALHHGEPSTRSCPVCRRGDAGRRPARPAARDQRRSRACPGAGGAGLPALRVRRGAGPVLRPDPGPGRDRRAVAGGRRCEGLRRRGVHLVWVEPPGRVVRRGRRSTAPGASPPADRRRRMGHLSPCGQVRGLPTAGQDTAYGAGCRPGSWCWAPGSPAFCLLVIAFGVVYA